MTAGRPLIIVTLGSSSLGGMREELLTLGPAGAGAAEVRVDTLPPREQEQLSSLFPTPLPLVATYRSSKEGGWGADAPEERAERLRRLAELPFAFVDVESELDSALLTEWANPSPRPRLIVSRHLPPEASVDQVREALRSRLPPGSIRKVVLPASLERFYAELRPLAGPWSPDEEVVFHTTAASGPILRARAGLLDMAAVYAAPPARGASRSTLPPVEPSQIPVDGLAPFLRRGARGRLYALLGHPVAHSISPRIHTTWYRRLDLPGLFVALDVASAEELRTTLEPMRQDGFAGFNVTAPWKQTALQIAGRASDDARTAGCANTLTFEQGEWSADNFDVGAVARRAQELKAEGTWSGEDALVLGSGGAARAALVAMHRLGVPTRILARDPGAAQALSDRMGSEVETSSDAPASLIVQATSVGRASATTLDVPWEGHVTRGTVLLDFVYAPEALTVQEAVTRRGGTYEDGGRLLVYQAIEVHRRWWGTAPPRALIEESMAEVGCAA